MSQSVFFLGLRRVAVAVAVTVASLVPPARAWAHELDLTTATVSLRDSHVEVVVNLDVVRLVGQFIGKSAPAGAPGSALGATMLAIAAESDLESYVARAREELQHGARLDVDGQSVALELRQFPAPPEVRGLAAQASAAPEQHANYIPVRFEARPSFEGARSISVTLPKVLGAVLFSFVQPRTRLGMPGASSTFAVLGASAAQPGSAGAWRWYGLCAIAFLLAGLALGANLFLFRQRSIT